MDSLELSQERLISVLAHRPQYILDGVINITLPYTPATTWRTTSSSSLGDLESLPLEILYANLVLLDLKSLSNLSKTCLRGRLIVTALPQYRDLVRHAPQALAALVKTRLVHHYPSAIVHAALLSANCVSCGRFGAFLFLPTCERCCYHCLWGNQSLWVVPLARARKCFGFSTAGAKTLPLMRSMPGEYNVRNKVFREKSIGLVCVGTSKKLAIAENRSEDCMRQDLEAKYSAGLRESEYRLLRHLQAAPLTPHGLEFFGKPIHPPTPEDMYCGMASVPFPHLVPGGDVEHGLWCLGCAEFSKRWSFGGAPLPSHLVPLVAPGCPATYVIRNLRDLAMSRATFLDHIKTCPCTLELLHAAAED